MIIPNIWENKKCSKPPTSIYLLKLVDFQSHIVFLNNHRVNPLKKKLIDKWFFASYKYLHFARGFPVKKCWITEA